MLNQFDAGCSKRLKCSVHAGRDTEYILSLTLNSKLGTPNLPLKAGRPERNPRLRGDRLRTDFYDAVPILKVS